MQDYLIRATAMNGKVRAFAAHTTSLVGEMARRHGTLAAATAALGRTATAAVMMGAMLENEEKLTIQIKGGGPLGQIVVDANAKGEVRGYVDHPQVTLPLNAVGKIDVARAVGTDGFLYVIKDIGLREPYRGGIPIVSGELGDDFTYYFAKSEQTPSAVALGVLVDVDYSVKAAGGFIIQLLPGATEEEIAELEARLAAIPSITECLTQGMDMETILEQVLHSVRVGDRMNIQFHCPCSRERVADMLISLGKKEIEGIIHEEGQAEIICHFCNEPYQFQGEELEQILLSIR